MMLFGDNVVKAVDRLKRVYSGEQARDVYCPGVGAGATNAAWCAQVVREELPNDQRLLSQEFIKLFDAGIFSDE